MAPVQRCEFCGVDNELARPAAYAPPPPLISPGFPPPPYVPHAPQPAGGAVMAIIMVSVLVVIGGAVSAILASRSATSAGGPPGVAAPYLGSGPSEPKPVPLSALHTTPLTWTADVKIDAPGRVGTPQHFDPLANWEWAESIGIAWWPDAKLYTLGANPIGKDGTTDLTGPAVSSIAPEVEYHFVSHDCRAREKTRAETAQDFKESSCSLEIQVHAASVSVRLDLIAVDQDGRSNPIPKPPCTIAQAFSYLEDAHKLTTRPTYAIGLAYDVFGNNYTVRAGKGAASMDGIDVSPTFCSKSAPKATGTSAATTPPVPTTPPIPTVDDGPAFDRGASTKAFKAANLASCRPAGVTGSLRIAVTFQPDGSASSATSSGPNAGTPFATCAEQKAKAIRVPAFSGGPTTVSLVVAE